MLTHMFCSRCSFWERSLFLLLVVVFQPLSLTPEEIDFFTHECCFRGVIDLYIVNTHLKCVLNNKILIRGYTRVINSVSH